MQQKLGRRKRRLTEWPVIGESIYVSSFRLDKQIGAKKEPDKLGIIASTSL
jgi:hypothetical protein